MKGCLSVCARIFQQVILTICAAQLIVQVLGGQDECGVSEESYFLVMCETMLHVGM